MLQGLDCNILWGDCAYLLSEPESHGQPFCIVRVIFFVIASEVCALALRLENWAEFILLRWFIVLYAAFSTTELRKFCIKWYFSCNNDI